MRARLNPFDFSEDDDINEYSVQQRLVWFFLNNHETFVKNQKKLCEAVNGLDGLDDKNRTITQGTISKKLKGILNRRFLSNGKMFMITKDEPGYCILLDENIKSKALLDMIDKNCFKKRYVFHERIAKPSLFVFWVSPEDALSKKEAKRIEDELSAQGEQDQEALNKRKRKHGGIKMIKAFKDYLGEGYYEDIFIFQDKLVIMLDNRDMKSNPVSDNLMNLFEIHKHRKFG